MNKFNPFENLLTFMKRDFTTFNMSNFHQFSCKLGKLNAVRVDSVLPSDYWKGNVTSVINVAPLIAPAFTRIKAIFNSFYVSYPQIWNYWNQFISNRPSDAYLNQANTWKYANVYQEPSIPMLLIHLLAKIVKGYCNLVVANGFICIERDAVHTKSMYNWHYTLENGLRKYELLQLRDKQGGLVSTPVDSSLFDTNTPPSYTLIRVVRNPDSAFSNAQGFYNGFSFFYHQLKEVYENLKSFGLPMDLIAKTENFQTYFHEKLNALPFFAHSKIWQDYFRNPQLQGTELNYGETNGCLCDVYCEAGWLSANPLDTQDSKTQFGWTLRVADIPLSSRFSGTIQFKTLALSNYIDYSYVFSLLTGVSLTECFKDGVSVDHGLSNVLALLPQHYNGLLAPRYRNFENDIFTTAAVDPMQGSVSLAVPSTIEELRSQSKLEEFLERNTAARNFVDFLKSHWGTHAESVSNQRCKLLGTSITNVNVGQVLQTSQTTNGSDGSPLGTRGGVASGYNDNGYLLSNNFQEHGCIITYMSFVLDNQYFQGLPEIFQHHADYLAYPWPEFANLGLEKIDSRDIYYGHPNETDYYLGESGLRTFGLGNAGGNASDTQNDVNLSWNHGLRDPFGYTPRYSKYKYKLDQLSGEFTDSLDFWNTFREFSSRPALCHNFINYENAVFMSNLDRIFSTTDELSDKFYVDLFFDFSVSRCLPLVANPTLD